MGFWNSAKEKAQLLSIAQFVESPYLCRRDGENALLHVVME